MLDPNILCPNCGSHDVYEIEIIPTADLINYYKDNGMDVRYLFEKREVLHKLRCGECSLVFFSPVVLGDDFFYSCLQKGDWYYQDEKPEYDYVASLIKPTDKVLDVGSGRGAFSKKIKCDFYQGLEFSESAVKLAEKDGINVIPEMVQDHAQKRSEYYDVVSSFQVLEHVSDARGFLEGSVKCLRRGGILTVAVPNCESFLEWRKNYLNMPPHHQLHWNEKALRKIAQVHGLKIKQVYKEPVSEIHRESFYSILLQTMRDKLAGVKEDRINFAPQTARDSAESFSEWREKRDFAHRVADLLIKGFRLIRLHRLFVGHTITAVYEKR